MHIVIWQESYDYNIEALRFVQIMFLLLYSTNYRYSGALVIIADFKELSFT